MPLPDDGIKYSALPAAGPLDGTETFPVVQGGVTKKAPIGTFVRFAPLPTGVAATDTANLQAAVDAFGTTASMRGGRLLLQSGDYLLNDTLLLRKKSVQLAGAGWGSPGTGTALKWAAGAGNTKPMVRLHECYGTVVSGIRFQGGDVAADKPTAGISNYNITGDTNGNSFNRIENCWFGSWPWASNLGALGVGILWHGDNINNDQSHVLGCRVSGCDIGISVEQTQNVINHIQDTHITGCGIGLKTVASIQLTNVFISQCTTRALDIDSGASVMFTNFGSEGCAQFAKLRNASALLGRFGYFQISNSLQANGEVVDGRDNTGLRLELEDFGFREQGYTNPTPWTIVMKAAAGGGGTKVLVLPETGGLTAARLDVGLATTSAYCHIEGSDAASKKYYRNILDGTNNPNLISVVDFGRIDRPFGANGPNVFRGSGAPDPTTNSILRTARLGDIYYRTDTPGSVSLIYVCTSEASPPVFKAIHPLGTLGLAQKTATQNFTTAADLTGLSKTVTIEASRRIKLSAVVSVAKNATASAVNITIQEGATVLAQSYTTHAASAYILHTPWVELNTPPSAGDHTYKVVGACDAGAADVSASATGPAQLVIEDMGPA